MELVFKENVINLSNWKQEKANRKLTPDHPHKYLHQQSTHKSLTHVLTIKSTVKQITALNNYSWSRILPNIYNGPTDRSQIIV